MLIFNVLTTVLKLNDSLFFMSVFRYFLSDTYWQFISLIPEFACFVCIYTKWRAKDTPITISFKDKWLSITVMLYPTKFLIQLIKQLQYIKNCKNYEYKINMFMFLSTTCWKISVQMPMTLLPATAQNWTYKIFIEESIISNLILLRSS